MGIGLIATIIFFIVLIVTIFKQGRKLESRDIEIDELYSRLDTERALRHELNSKVSTEKRKARMCEDRMEEAYQYAEAIKRVYARRFPEAFSDAQWDNMFAEEMRNNG